MDKQPTISTSQPDFPRLGNMDRQGFYNYLLKECNLTETTVFTYEQGLKRLTRMVGKEPEKITVSDLRVFLQSDYGPATKSSALSALRAFHKWGAVEGLWHLNGIMALRGPKIIFRPKPSLQPEQVKVLLNTARSSIARRVLVLGLYAGLRVTESSLVEDFTDRINVFGKGRKMREVPVHPQLESEKEMILARPASGGVLMNSCRALAGATKIQFSSHSLRRTFATQLRENKVPREVIASILGHQLGVTELYAPVTFKEMREAVETVSY